MYFYLENRANGNGMCTYEEQTLPMENSKNEMKLP